MNGHRRFSHEHGSALIVGLIMLLMITLFALSSFNMGKSSLEIAGNAQQTNAMVMAANDAIQEAVSTTRMFQTPNAVFLASCGGIANTRCFDTNGNGKTDVTVTLTSPSCVQAHIIPNIALKLTDKNDTGCLVGVQQTFGIVGSASGDSLCSNSLWDLNATAVDNATLATAAVTEGVTVRVSTATILTFCP